MLRVLLICVLANLLAPMLAFGNDNNSDHAYLEKNDQVRDITTFHMLPNRSLLLTYDQLSRIPNSDWKTVKNAALPSGENFWIYTDINARGITEPKWFLHYENPLASRLEVFIEVNGVLQNYYSSGVGRPFDARPVYNREFLFPIDIPSDAKIRVYMGVGTSRNILTRVRLISQFEFYREQEITAIQLTLLYGALLMMVVYNMILFAMVRDLSYLWYSLSVAAMLIVQVGASGVLFEWLIPAKPVVNSMITTIFLWVFHIFSALFCIQVLELKSLSKSAYNGFLILIFSNLFLVGFSVSINQTWVSGIGYMLGIVNYVSYVAVGIYAWRKGVGYAIYFTVGWFFICAVRIRVNAGILTGTYYFGLSYWVLLALFWEAVLLSIALAVRIKDLQNFEIKEKEEFFTRISHELRTPINGLLGSLELLFPRNNSNRNNELVRCLTQSAYHLYDIVQEILTFSKYSRRGAELKKEVQNFRDFIANVQTNYLQLTVGKGLLSAFSIGRSIPSQLKFDRACLNTVLAKLLENACKYTENGFVVIYVTELDRRNQQVLLRFSVRDTGIGIEADKLANIFQTFQQSETYYHRQYQGLGLGLSTVAECLRIMGSRIQVHSTPGKGSTFYFDLWLPYEEQQVPAVNEFSLSGLRALVVEDNPVNQLITKKLLENAGVKVDIAANGEDGVLQVKQNRYDVVLMDCAMPILNGFEATQKIREMGYYNLPIIAVTANAMEGDKEICLRSGMDDYIAKPVSTRTLLTTISKYIGIKFDKTG